MKQLFKVSKSPIQKTYKSQIGRVGQGTMVEEKSKFIRGAGVARVRFLVNPGRHMWVEFVVASRPCSERFFSSKTNNSKFQFDLEYEGHRFFSRNRLFFVSPFSNKVDLLSGMPWGRPR